MSIMCCITTNRKMKETREKSSCNMDDNRVSISSRVGLAFCSDVRSSKAMEKVILKFGFEVLVRLRLVCDFVNHT